MAERRNRFRRLFEQPYQRVTDPACAAIAANLRSFCTNTALADANGNIVLQNARPGQAGTLGLRPIEVARQLGFRCEHPENGARERSENVHPSRGRAERVQPPDTRQSSLNINTGTFGQITTKTGNRILQAQLSFRLLIQDGEEYDSDPTRSPNLNSRLRLN